MNVAEIPRKEGQKASQHLTYFMDVEFESTGQLLYRFPGYCLITLEVIFPFLRSMSVDYGPYWAQGKHSI